MARSYESDANDNNIVRGRNANSSGSSSDNTVPSFTHLGRREVPITSSCQELLDAIERFRWDVPFTAELIRKSSVYFPDNQLVLIQNVLDAADIERQFGYEQRFIEDLIDFEASLDSRIEEEEVFFTAQKKRCTEIYEILRQSSFPYSATQASCLYRMLTALYQITGHPNSETDKNFLSGLRELVRLVQLDDHLRDPTPHRFIVANTIHYYLHNMVTKLDLLAKEEGGRNHPDFIHPNSQIDLAIYLVVNLGAVVDSCKVLTPREHFHHGMVEVYTKLVEIFKQSGLDFSHVQEVVIHKIERRVRDLKKDPLVTKHHGIVEALLEFMSELEENNPDREVKLDGDKVVWAEEGEVNKAVQKIGWSLVYLQPVATEHLNNFPSFGHGVENVVAKMMERFLALYPFH